MVINVNLIKIYIFPDFININIYVTKKKIIKFYIIFGKTRIFFITVEMSKGAHEHV